ncbi:MAG: sigma-70 family RNA polymerase sigma factor [Planctomycetota bacterium]|nr:sigma-70 family RNA polymerase sigma factor [Planctomycetota bacterium]
MSSAAAQVDNAPTSKVRGRRAAKRADRKARRAERQAEDVRLVRLVLEGDHEAFRSLVERYQKPLFWIAHDILLDREEARDVAQEAFIRVHTALERYDQKRDFVNWLYRIARNLAIDALRRRRRRANPTEDLTRIPLDAPPARGRAELDLPDRVAEVLEELPVEYRLALTLREFHGMTPREIAQVTDCSYPTARWRLHRARNLFRNAWEKRFGTASTGEDYA